jgi:hypothetical protein
VCFSRMKCLICDSDQGHLPGCLMMELNAQLGTWSHDLSMDPVPLPWAPDTQTWSLDDMIDPNGVLPLRDMANHNLDEVCEVLRGLAGELESEPADGSISPVSSQALRVWLEDDRMESVVPAPVPMVQPNSPLPAAWASFHTGLATLDVEDRADDPGHYHR